MKALGALLISSVAVLGVGKVADRLTACGPEAFDPNRHVFYFSDGGAVGEWTNDDGIVTGYAVEEDSTIYTCADGAK